MAHTSSNVHRVLVVCYKSFAHMDYIYQYYEFKFLNIHSLKNNFEAVRSGACPVAPATTD